MAKRGRGGSKTTARKATKMNEEEEPPSKMTREESFNSKLKKAIIEVKTADSSKAKTFKPDAVLISNVKGKIAIYEDYACMLNQSNIGNNNNKFYVIQIAQQGNQFITFNRWGRVGEDGMNKIEKFKDADAAISSFKKKFKDKTKNNWEDKANFIAHPGKYTLLDLDDEDDDEDEIDSKLESAMNVTTAEIQSKLDGRTFLLIKLIFNTEMFTSQMTQMNLDVRRMPLGKLSKIQIAKGLEALIDVEVALKAGKNSNVLAELSSKFYTLVPHNFGRMIPPTLDNQAVIDKKKEVMMVLSDIELSQSLQKQQVAETKIHPLDEKYQKLDCQLEILSKDSHEYKIISTYARACKGYRRNKLLDIWRVDRKGSDKRFNLHKDIGFRKLLWHGTSVAVVAAILKAGLRIMPHSGGRVGRGIYFASEHSKSAGYVGSHYGKFEDEQNVGFMFLSEVALGNMKFIKADDSSLRSAPKGYHSVVARGWTEPDPKKDVKLPLDGRDVAVPLGNPVKQKEYEKSSFDQSEYLIYKESQAKIRYLLKFSFY